MNKLKIFSLLILALSFAACSQEQDKDYTAYVNPFIGTGGHGHTFPGAVAVNGMVQLSPDTRHYEWDACAGYHYTDTLINGFSHTHLSGTGIGDYADVLVMPISGELQLAKMGEKDQNTSFASVFSHSSEKAVPGYYSVKLDRYNVAVELTASKRAGLHKYTFGNAGKSGLLIDLDYSIYNQITKDLVIEALSDTKVRGYKQSQGWANDQRIYFYAVSSKPFASTNIVVDNTLNEGTKVTGKQGKIFLQFETEENEEVYLKVGLSAVDYDGAKRNLEAEIPAWDFNKVRVETRKEWNEFLAKVNVETNNDSLKNIFYTAMYHTAIAPNIFSDVDGRYRGMDNKIHQSDNVEYTVFSTWDTMRALHPMFSIISPSKNNAYIRSLLSKYQEGGILPMWELAGNYTGTMIGYNSVPIIADAYVKGETDFDKDLAYEAILRSSVFDREGIIAPSDNFVNALVQESKKHKNELGYIPCDKEGENVAKGLEYAFQDFCILQVAKERKDSANIKRYTQLAENYKNYFDKETGFMRGRHKDGTWRTPFNPRNSSHRADDYCEGTAWQWTWFVPHDIDGLIGLMGGKEPFVKKLDGLFTASSEVLGDKTSVDITGLIGQYAHGNEPSHHIMHLYNHIGEAYKTQELVDSVLYTLYVNQPDGLSGNEDCGQMSAWYVLNAMGFYQVCPGDPVYSIGRPIFDKVAINLENGNIFEIIAHNNNKDNKYVQSIKLNGKVLETPYFTHEQLMQGGTLELEMNNKH